MNIVIPMAGAGSRFKRAGYTTPKPLLQAHGKTLLEWSVDSLPIDLAQRLIFIGLEEHRTAFDLENSIRTIYRDREPTFLWLPGTTRGQAETVWLARDLIDSETGLMIFNIDTAFRSQRLREALLSPDHDGILGAFNSTDPRFSFAATDAEGRVTKVREKEPISRYALTGLYHFARASDFLGAAEEAIQNGETEKGEYYVAPLYNKLISRNASFKLDACSEHWILGTPEEYRQFLDNPPSGR